jgi:starch-binding outer membrane protein SusE/F
MKNILKITAFAFLLVSINSCQEDKITVARANGFTLKTPTSGTTFILSPDGGDDDLANLEWTKSDNGALTISTYIIEIAKTGTNFENPINANGGSYLNETSFLWKEGYLNSLLKVPDFTPGVSVEIDVRIKSTLGSGTNPFSQYSNVIKLNVTPFAKPSLAFTKNGDNPATSPKIISGGFFNSDCDGYMALTPGSYTFFTAFQGQYLSSNPFYGDDDSGSFNTLALNGTAYDVSTAGNYRVKANIASTGTNALSYSVTPISAWGIIGNAKVIGSANSLPAMTYDAAAKKYKITINLKGGKVFKFRANNSNTITLGRFSAAKINADYGGTEMSYDGLDIPVPGITTESYDVTLDLSNPRDYKYTLVLHQ